jgi:hypothetical protein
MPLEPTDYKPDGQPGHKSIRMGGMTGEGFDSIDLGLPGDILRTGHPEDEWQLLLVKEIQQQEDFEFTLNCPEDVEYEVNRQRFIAGEVPTNRIQRAQQLVRHAPEDLRNGVQMARNLANNTVAQAQNAYDAGGAIAIATSAVSSGFKIARGLRSAVSSSTLVGRGGWYATPSSDDKLRRRKRDGSSYSLPEFREAAAGGKAQRDLAIDEEDGDWEDETLERFEVDGFRSQR